MDLKKNTLQRENNFGKGIYAKGTNEISKIIEKTFNFSVKFK